jgi:integrase
MLVEDYLRPAAVKAGILAKDDERRFGFHTCRHSLATFLVAKDFDPKTVQALLRHSDIRRTLGLYAHADMEKGLLAQGQMLEAMLCQQPVGQVN